MFFVTDVKISNFFERNSPPGLASTTGPSPGTGSVFPCRILTTRQNDINDRATGPQSQNIRYSVHSSSNPFHTGFYLKTPSVKYFQSNGWFLQLQLAGGETRVLYSRYQTCRYIQARHISHPKWYISCKTWNRLGSVLMLFSHLPFKPPMRPQIVSSSKRAVSMKFSFVSVTLLQVQPITYFLI
jgi:hypothetical protein